MEKCAMFAFFVCVYTRSVYLLFTIAGKISRLLLKWHHNKTIEQTQNHTCHILLVCFYFIRKSQLLNGFLL